MAWALVIRPLIYCSVMLAFLRGFDPFTASSLSIIDSMLTAVTLLRLFGAMLVRDGYIIFEIIIKALPKRKHLNLTISPVPRVSDPFSPSL